MADVKVTLDARLGATWTQAFRQAVTQLNTLFNRKGITVTLTLTGAGPVITVRTDPGIGTTAVHGEATTERTTAGRLVRSEVRLPVRIQINTPRGLRPAGPGIYLVVAAHELVHSLGHDSHNTHLMAQVFQKVMGNSPAGDRMQAGSVLLPPLQLSDDSVQELKDIWG
jgi:predicted Zn-dependent protease